MFFKAFRKMHKLGKRAHVHQMLGALIVVAHASEIVRVVTHITVWHLLVAITIFSIWLITQQGGNAEELA